MFTIPKKQLYNEKKKWRLLMSELWDVEEIVIQAQQGDEAAFVQLVKKYERLVYYIAVQKMGNDMDAMDVVQETFIEVRKSIQHLKEPRFFKAWLNRIVFSKISRYYEKRKDRVMDERELHNVHKLQEQRTYMSPEKSMKYETNKDLLHACMRQLKPIYQDVLILQYFEEFSMQEIAETLHIPLGTVKSRISVAKKELRYLLEEMEKQEGITLDFNSVGLEAFLISAFAQSYEQVILPSGKTIVKGNKVLRNLQAHPFLATVIGSSVLMGSVAGAWGAYTSYQNMKKAIPSPEQMVTQTSNSNDSDPFPNIIYQGETINTARRAYEILYNATFTDQKQNQEDLQHVYQTLKDYGGSYASMADYIYNYIE